MKELLDSLRLTRRRFLARTARQAGAVGIGLAAAGAPRSARAAARRDSKALEYNLDAFKQTDPRLVRYEETGRITAPLKGLRRVTVGPRDDLYLAGAKAVAVLDSRGARKFELGLGEPVRCVAVAPEGIMYVGLRNRIEVYDAQRQRLTTWKASDERTWFTSLALGEKDLFASDAGNRVVVHFDHGGKVLGRLGEKNKERNIPGFVVPSPYFDLEIGPDDYLWVVNPGRHQLEAYTFDGALKTSWGEAGFDIRSFCGCCNPAAFTRLPDGRFVTCEKGLARVKIYGPDGRFDCVVAGPEQFPRYLESRNETPLAMDVAVDSQGRVLVADVLANDLRIFTSKKG